MHTTQVNKHWYLLLKTCDSYWRAQCEKHGIIGETLKHEKEKVESFRNLCISALKFEHRLRKMSGVLKLKSLSINEEFNDCIMPILPLSNGYYYHHQPSSESSLSVLKFDHPNSTIGRLCATIPDPFPGGLLKVLWSFSSLSSVVLYGNNGRWIKFSFDGHRHPLVEEWQDVIYNVVSYRSTICLDCSRIIVMSTSLNSDVLWQLQMIQLHRGKTRPTKNTVTFNFMPDQHYQQEPFFTVNKVEIIPQSCANDHKTNHLLLVQFGGAVVSFSLTTQHDKCFISDSLNVFAASEMSCIKLIPNRFTLSLDRSLLALISSQPLQLCVYNLNSFSESKCNIGHLFVSCRQEFVHGQCLAVGKLFSILTFVSTSDYSIFIVSTHTGNTIQQCCMLNTLPYLDMLVNLYAPSNQQWLNTLELSSSCEIELCVSVCIDKSTRTPGCTLVLLI